MKKQKETQNDFEKTIDGAEESQQVANQPFVKQLITKWRLKFNFWKWLAIGLVAVLAILQFFDINAIIHPRFGNFQKQQQLVEQSDNNQIADAASVNLEQAVLPVNGAVLPVVWGDLGKQMAEYGVIDSQKFEALYASRGGLDENTKKLLYNFGNGRLIINQQNSGIILNLLWAFGLANKNQILEKGPITDPQYGGASGFASTGGWSLAKGKAMDHYSKYALITLTSQQQALVEKVSQNIYRPCCGNSTYFPDCNHGMAMLGLLELMAAQGVSEQQMYKVALQVNAYWFPDTYLTIAKYFQKRGVSWDKVDSKEALGASYSSASGYRQVLSEIEPVAKKQGSSCGI